MVGVTGLSWIVIGLIPEDVNLTGHSIGGHSIGALPIFILGNIGLIVAGVSASTRTRSVVRRTALILGVLELLGFALTALAIAYPRASSVSEPPHASPSSPTGLGAHHRT